MSSDPVRHEQNYRDPTAAQVFESWLLIA